MVSSFGYPSFKQFDLDRRIRFVYMLLVPLFFVLIAIDPPTMLLSMFGTYALSAPLLVGRAGACGAWCAVRRPGAWLSVPTQRRQQYLEAMGIDVWVPRAARRRNAAAATCGASPAPPARPCRRRARGRPGRRLRAAEVAALHALCAAPDAHPGRCLGWGPQRADWLVIGEAPGAEEDRRGEPFVGAPDSCWMRCCAPSAWIAAHERLHRQHAEEPPAGQPRPEAGGGRRLPAVPGAADRAAAAPKIMLAVGRIAAQNLLGTDAPPRDGCAARCITSASLIRRWSSRIIRPTCCAHRPTSARRGRI